MDVERINLLGIKIHNLGMYQVLDQIDGLIKAGKPSLVCTANPNHLRLYKSDPEFARIYDEADLVTADGKLMIWASIILGIPIKEKVSGSDLSAEICKISNERNYKIFFLGAAPGVADTAKARCEKLYPGTRIVGIYSPERSELLDNEKSMAIIGRINATGANVMLVALGAPLQEKWIKKHLSVLKVPVSIGVGGSIDYLADKIKRPPMFVRKIGMEWLSRILQNPRWYWKRYLLDLKIFHYVFIEKTKSKK